MYWDQARIIIEKNIKVGTDINSERSTLRKILSTNHPCYSERYGYNGEDGFLAKISNYESNNLSIPWSMLENCFEALITSEGYSGSYFRKEYPLQVKDHSCHVYIVGVIFERAGIARKKGNSFFIK